jgi:hypothetical protein
MKDSSDLEEMSYKKGNVLQKRGDGKQGANIEPERQGPKPLI